jgi:predicted nucleotidyltransferase
MKVLTKVLVGSRLHGLNNEQSDYDYRGIHIHDLKDVLSPFTTLKNTTWIEGDEDNTSYELADFCKGAVHGNATILEVFFSNHIILDDPITKKMRKNWVKFIDTDRVVMAGRGYASNQLNKMQLFDDIGVKPFLLKLKDGWSDEYIPECTELFAKLQADVTKNWKTAKKIKPDIEWIEEFIHEAYTT